MRVDWDDYWPNCPICGSELVRDLSAFGSWCSYCLYLGEDPLQLGQMFSLVDFDDPEKITLDSEDESP